MDRNTGGPGNKSTCQTMTKALDLDLTASGSSPPVKTSLTLRNAAGLLS